MIKILRKKNKSRLVLYLLLRILVMGISCLFGTGSSSNFNLVGGQAELTRSLIAAAELKKSQTNLENLRKQKIKQDQELVQKKENLYRLQEQNKMRKKKRLEEEIKREHEERKLKNNRREIRQKRKQKVKEKKDNAIERSKEVNQNREKAMDDNKEVKNERKKVNKNSEEMKKNKQENNYQSQGENRQARKGPVREHRAYLDQEIGNMSQDKAKDKQRVNVHNQVGCLPYPIPLSPGPFLIQKFLNSSNTISFLCGGTFVLLFFHFDNKYRYRMNKDKRVNVYSQVDFLPYPILLSPGPFLNQKFLISSTTLSFFFGGISVLLFFHLDNKYIYRKFLYFFLLEKSQGLNQPKKLNKVITHVPEFLKFNRTAKPSPKNSDGAHLHSLYDVWLGSFVMSEILHLLKKLSSRKLCNE